MHIAVLPSCSSSLLITFVSAEHFVFCAERFPSPLSTVFLLCQGVLGREENILGRVEIYSAEKTLKCFAEKKTARQSSNVHIGGALYLWATVTPDCFNIALLFWR